ncbi:hypothetical protein AVEN_33941-1 [Araneus ventricosus]|uniref:Uncharacterized protein n=1 Tax=Araneus ventricosus TaxID=182803 RepID=A0A4Y2JZP4_ARAVE|nr:hypothetical protein AVEN_33941-1 [Araneus ventricosus]
MLCYHGEGHHQYVDEKLPDKKAGSRFFWGYNNGVRLSKLFADDGTHLLLVVFVLEPKRPVSTLGNDFNPSHIQRSFTVQPAALKTIRPVCTPSNDDVSTVGLSLCLTHLILQTTFHAPPDQTSYPFFKDRLSTGRIFTNPTLIELMQEISQYHWLRGAVTSFSVLAVRLIALACSTSHRRGLFVVITSFCAIPLAQDNSPIDLNNPI